MLTFMPEMEGRSEAGEMRKKEDEAKKKAKLKGKREKEGQKEKKKITQDIETIPVGIKVARKLLKSDEAQLKELTHTHKSYR